MNTCFICKQNKPYWLLLKNDKIHVDENNQNIGDTIQTCSYSCSMKCNKFLPKPYKHLILNQEDFCWLMPIVPKRNNFKILSFDEIHKLDDNSKNEYYKKFNEIRSLDSFKYEIYNDLYNEDMNTFQIENDYSDESSDYCDDY